MQYGAFCVFWEDPATSDLRISLKWGDAGDEEGSADAGELTVHAHAQAVGALVPKLKVRRWPACSCILRACALHPRPRPPLSQHITPPPCGFQDALEAEDPVCDADERPEKRARRQAPRELTVRCSDERDALVHRAVLKLAYTGELPPEAKEAPWLLAMVTVADKLLVSRGAVLLPLCCDVRRPTRLPRCAVPCRWRWAPC